EIGAVVQQVIARADAEAAAVQPYHDRPRFAVETRREDIEREAVLALRGMSVQRGHDRRRLLGARLDRRGERDLEVILDAGPRGGRPRRHEPILARRRRAVRHAPELVHAVLEQPADAAGASSRDAAYRREPAILTEGHERQRAERERGAAPDERSSIDARTAH